MANLKNFTNLLLGKERDPFEPGIFKNIALVALMAWIGLGADGISSSCYGPEQAFLALGPHNHLAIYLAILTAVTVFIISLGYNQVIDLFPSGGGGYKVATELLGPYPGLVSGVALLIDYVLTIAISAASSVDAFFSLLSPHDAYLKVPIEGLLIILLIGLNLRGMRESIKFLLPIFIGFIVLHVAIIFYGIIWHHTGITHVFHAANVETFHMSQTIGGFAVAAILLHAYSLGSGTYTGLEAVSNNVNRLAEPRVRTGKITMIYMALSLSFMAAGITLLYLLWNAHFVPGQTLNATVFHEILGNSSFGHIALITILLFEAGILIVAANTGFLAGPAVLANMSLDRWVPKRFHLLSTRLVTQNGILLFGIASIFILFLTHGDVSSLVIFYSINVFLTFTITLLGLCVYWLKTRTAGSKHWISRFLFSLLGFLTTFAILLIVVAAKFREDGWVSLLFTLATVLICLAIRKHYLRIEKKQDEMEKMLSPVVEVDPEKTPELQYFESTAVFFIGREKSAAMHTLLWAIRMFPNQFKNLLFVSVGEVDLASFRGNRQLKAMEKKVESNLSYFVEFAHSKNFGSRAYSSYGTNPIELLTDITENIAHEFPKAVFFATRLVFEKENWLTRVLHNYTALTLQRRLHNLGHQLIILPMKI